VSDSVIGNETDGQSTKDICCILQQRVPTPAHFRHQSWLPTCHRCTRCKWEWHGDRSLSGLLKFCQEVIAFYENDKTY